MTSVNRKMSLYAGSVNHGLAEKIARELNCELGNVELKKFSNGEIYARFSESVRGEDLFLIQSVSGTEVNDALMELLIMADAARRASARTITAVVSHYGYSRQDRKAAAREPITAKLVANLMQVSGIDRVMSIDLHQNQIQGFFDIPVDHLTALPILAEYFLKKELPKEDLCVVSPDVGRAKAAKKLSDLLEADLAIMHKGRPGHNKAVITALIGDVKDKICVLNDDMIDTGGSVVAAVDTLHQNGAKEVYVCATHPIFSGPGLERMANLNASEVVVCDTIEVPQEYQNDKIKVVSVAPLFARGIHTVFHNGSVSKLFDVDFSNL